MFTLILLSLIGSLKSMVLARESVCHEGFRRRGTCPILPSNPIVSLMTLALKTKPNHGDGIVLPVFAQTCRLNEADQYYT